MVRTYRWVTRLTALAGLRRRCGASGWQVHRGCSDCAGSAVCPVCERTVPTHEDRAARLRRVRRIKVHAA